ncbi:PP2C family protein-serine/threonine phosphatase [Catenuloplanes indicus]|uniref:Serine phosphatase RsbU (Regulator of sigma subunit) n=1 Tax=Catenuloplanes indicus TaxID=137267 RepID=A0AAE4AZ09_9ACTN|nr:PP2C family protein-serine/threonine phosphatase [Catenuloplanes indicus]MDQ0367952.1 serine phosphatase RsbU (regulator of sigma subunit) [Catenuloplanes indicus]
MSELASEFAGPPPPGWHDRLAEVESRLAAEHRLAAGLQHILLPIPAAPVDLGALRVAVRYLPAEHANRVGGDWFHATEAPDGSVVLAVGDVAGHGLGAAATMAQVRHALATLLITTTTAPAELLAHLNRVLLAAGAETRTVTAVVARWDAATGTMTWAQAGHPAPLHARDGRTVELDRPAGPLLGVFRDPCYGTAVTALDAHDLLVFYTDGLVEHRRHSLAEGLAPVVETLGRISAARGPAPLSDLLGQLPPANPEDDTCILAVRLLTSGVIGDG